MFFKTKRKTTGWIHDIIDCFTLSLFEGFQNYFWLGWLTIKTKSTGSNDISTGWLSHFLIAFQKPIKSIFRWIKTDLSHDWLLKTTRFKSYKYGFSLYSKTHRKWDWKRFLEEIWFKVLQDCLKVVHWFKNWS